MKWLNIIGSILEILIPVLGHLGKKKVVRELEVVATGVEKFSKAETSSGKGKILKDTIRTIALTSGVEGRLRKRIDDWQTRLWKKIF